MPILRKYYEYYEMLVEAAILRRPVKTWLRQDFAGVATSRPY